MHKTQLLQTLRAERREWEALLDVLGEAPATRPGAAGHWSVKDIVAHVTAYESWLVDWLQAAARGAFPAPSVLDDADVDRRNARVYAAAQAQSWPEVLAEAGRAFQALLDTLEAFSEEDLTDARRAEWFVKPYWTRHTKVWECVLNLTVEHYHEHAPQLKAWRDGWPATEQPHGD